MGARRSCGQYYWCIKIIVHNTGSKCITGTFRYKDHNIPVLVITATDCILKETHRLTAAIEGVQEAGQMPMDASSTTQLSRISSYQYGNPRQPNTQFLPWYQSPQTSLRLLAVSSGTCGPDVHPWHRLRLFHQHHHWQRYRQHTQVLPTHQDPQIPRHLDTWLCQWAQEVILRYSWAQGHQHLFLHQEIGCPKRTHVYLWLYCLQLLSSEWQITQDLAHSGWWLHWQPLEQEHTHCQSYHSITHFQFHYLYSRGTVLRTPMEHYEHMCLQLDIFPREIIDKYNITNIVDANEWVYINIGRIGLIPSFLKSGMLISHLCRPSVRLSPGEY